MIPPSKPPPSPISTSIMLPIHTNRWREFLKDTPFFNKRKGGAGILAIQASSSKICHIYNRKKKKKKETELDQAASSKNKKYEY